MDILRAVQDTWLVRTIVREELTPGHPCGINRSDLCSSGLQARRCSHPAELVSRILTRKRTQICDLYSVFCVCRTGTSWGESCSHIRLTVWSCPLQRKQTSTITSVVLWHLFTLFALKLGCNFVISIFQVSRHLCTTGPFFFTALRCCFCLFLCLEPKDKLNADILNCVCGCGWVCWCFLHVTLQKKPDNNINNYELLDQQLAPISPFIDAHAKSLHAACCTMHAGHIHKLYKCVYVHCH